MKYEMEKTLRMPNQYSVIPEAELQDLNGGIGADPVDDGKYNLFNNISDLTAPLERAFIRLFDVDYDTQQQLNLGFAALGVFETVLNALNPSAHQLLSGPDRRPERSRQAGPVPSLSRAAFPGKDSCILTRIGAARCPPG